MNVINTLLLAVLVACAVFNTIKPYFPKKEVKWPWLADYESLDEESR